MRSDMFQRMRHTELSVTLVSMYTRRHFDCAINFDNQVYGGMQSIKKPVTERNYLLFSACIQYF